MEELVKRLSAPTRELMAELSRARFVTVKRIPVRDLKAKFTSRFTAPPLSRCRPEMPETFALKPTHKAVRGYHLALAQLANVGAKHETALREAWHNLIEAGAGPLRWTLVREYGISRKGAASLRLDGALLDEYRLVHGCLAAKDHPDTVLSDPNRNDDEEYIVRLVGQVVTVSVETMKLVQSLPTLGDGAPAVGYTQAEMDAAHHDTVEEKPAE